MQAIGFKQSLPISEKDSFIQFETTKPMATGHDILVDIKAVSINPVDYKVRKSSAKKALSTPKIIGWDAVGTVVEVGEKVSLFKVGDKVFYAGDIKRSGSNAEYQLVDERIVGHAPKNRSLAELAAMPLTSLTAYEILFDRLRLRKNGEKGKSILIIGGAGGVGSVAIQLAKKMTQLTVIATASRPETRQWCLDLGADKIVNHRDLLNSMKAEGIAEVDYIVNFANTEMHWDSMAVLIKPQGHIASIVETSGPINLDKLKGKSVSFSWELMFTRSMFETEDMAEQHRILTEIAELLDTETIKSTLSTTLEGFSTENFKKAHALQETGKAIGKTVIVF